MRIAVDVSALATPGNGIARYLGAMLGEMLASTGPQRQWLLYGREEATAIGSGLAAASTVRADGLPRHAGRVLSLFTSQPWWLRRDRPAVFWGPAHRLPAWLPSATARVLTIHDLCWREAPATMRRSTRLLDALAMPRALQRADRIIAVSQATAASLAAHWPEHAGRIRVVHEAASLPVAPDGVQSLAGRGVTPPYALFVGTIEPRKNIEGLIAAFARVRREGAAGMLVLAGAMGWGGVDPQRLAEQAGCTEQVRILGPVDDALLATLYRHARCLVMPSLYEGFGLPALEALGYGTPVLASNRASLPEVVGDAGVLVDPADRDALADALRRLMADDAHREALAALAAAQFARFSWAKAARETLAVFDEAVQVRTQGARG